MQNKFYTFCLMISLCLTGRAQQGYMPPYPFEVGVNIGTTMFLGDLGGESGIGVPFLRDTDFSTIRPAIGIFGRWNLGTYFSLRADLSYMSVNGDDKYAGKGAGEYSPTDITRGGSDAAWFRWYRNLNFRSTIFEASVAAELIPYNFELGGGYEGYSVLSPYGFVGVGFFTFNPQGLYKGTWVDLKPLSTEGQGLVDGKEPYSLTQLNIPFGFGLKWNYNDQWALALEVNHRMTFTDYIDDVSTFYVNPKIFTDNMPPAQAEMATAMARRSVEIDEFSINGAVSSPNEQRGDPKDNDSFYTITVRFSYYFDPGFGVVGGPGFGGGGKGGGGRRYNCPVW